MIAVERTFGVDHPTAAGHFPGHPVIPGAVLLGELVHMLQASLGEALPTLEFKAVKFLHPVRPGDRLSIVIDAISEFDYKFECKLEQTTAVIGTLRRTDTTPVQQTS